MCVCERIASIMIPLTKTDQELVLNNARKPKILKLINAKKIELVFT